LDSGKTEEFLPNQILIKFKGAKTDGEIPDQGMAAGSVHSQLFKKYQVRSASRLFRKQTIGAAHRASRFASNETASAAFQQSFQTQGLANIYRVTLSEGADVMAAIGELRRLPEVEYAEPNYVYRIQSSLNDPFLATKQSWGQPYDDLWGLHKIAAPQAWNISTGAGVLVAVIDTGCDIRHSDIAGNIWINQGEISANGIDDDDNGHIDDVNGWDFVNQDNDIQDNHGHGTHISGIIAASGNNGLGIAGVAWGAQIMPVKGLDDSGRGNNAELANAILYAVQNGARVLNLSWGERKFSQVLEDALSMAASQNVVVIAAAGNNSEYSYQFYPANSRSVITVGASDHADSRPIFSNFGDSIDVLAPGGDDSDNSAAQIHKNILSLRASTLGADYSLPILSVGDGYLRQEGTSMAAAYVSGLAALILQRFPSATPEEVRQIIRRSADWIPDAIQQDTWGSANGYGRINVMKAMAITTLGSARILAPVPTTEISSESIPLKITASCPDFSRWDLEYFDAEMNSVSLYSSSSPHIDYRLPNWIIKSIPDGYYMLRLTVTNQKGEVFRDQVTVILNRVIIASPAAKSAFRAGQMIEFTGTASGGGFKKYLIQYQDLNSDEWRSDGIALVNSGTKKIRSGILGTWDTSGFDRPSAFRIRLIVERTNLDDVIRQTALIIDPTLHAGWPQNIGRKESSYGSSSTLSYLQHLIAADIDANGQMEIPVGYGDEVKVFRSDGTMARGWPQNIGQSYPNYLFQRSPLAADIDGDGYLEIAASARAMNPLFFVWDYQGNLRPGFPKEHCELQAIADLDGDGKMKFICTDWARLIILDANGEVSGEASLPRFEVPSVAVGDLGNDGKSEIIAFLYQDPDIWLGIYNGDGTTLPGWPKLISSKGYYPSLPPVLADLDADGALEIIYIDGLHVAAVRQDGSEMPGWPVAVPSGYVITGISAGYINGDRQPEIAVSLLGDLQLGEVYLVISADGSIMSGWPVEMPSKSWGNGSAAIVDLNGDGKKELIFGSGILPYSEISFSLHAVSSNGREIDGFPKPVSDIDPCCGNTPAVLDIDGDGLLEIAWLNSTGDLYMWDTSAHARNNSQDWPMSGHDARHTSALPRKEVRRPGSDVHPLDLRPKSTRKRPEQYRGN
jgi:hypothetical protein